MAEAHAPSLRDERASGDREKPCSLWEAVRRVQDRKRRPDAPRAQATTKRSRTTCARAVRREAHRGGLSRVPGVPLPLPRVDASGFYRFEASRRSKETRQDRTDALVRSWLDSLRARVRGTPSPCEWVVFSRQKDAFAYVDAIDRPMRVFSRECSADGRRTFLASTLDAFWTHYVACPEEQRHHYEIIRQDRPCHLYLDLEYPTWDEETKSKLNQEMDGNQRVNALLKLLRRSFEERFDCTFDNQDVVELESTKDGKFSRHVLVKVKGKAFKDAMHAGAFVKRILGEAYAEPEHEWHRKLFVNSGHRENERGKRRTTIVDTAVYTRNRAFRLMWSYKRGKKERLMPIFRLAPPTTENDKSLFLATLASQVEADSQLLCCEDVEQYAPGRRDKFKESNGNHHQHPREFQNSGGPSPHESIDNFVLSVASHGGVPARIRSWTHFPDMDMILYSMSDNRYCRRIQRSHKSNNVMYIADLKLGTVYQKCLDPECRDWKSESIPIPPEIMDRYNLDRWDVECDDAFWEGAFEQCQHLLQPAPNPAVEEASAMATSNNP